MSDDLLKLMGVSLRLGDCVELMRAMPDASVDSIVTDPPYELGFMGKGWDRTGIANNVAMWAEALRVLKPGGHLLAFSGTRTYHRMVCAIEDAGFEVRDQIGWAYGSGFPKSLDVSKAIDKAAGAEREVIQQGERSAERPVVEDQSGGKAYRLAGDASITAPATDAARQWQGWGTALKPAWEPICVARKPLIGTVAANVLAHGTGGLNIDGCRVEGEHTYTPRLTANSNLNDDGWQKIGQAAEPVTVSGRWPANLIHDGSDEVLAAFPGDGDSSAARFYYAAKASKSDRGDGNTHPTVKPTDLMRYLCRLVTPPGGVVLDPFMGSGSTGKAAILEGFQFVGIDMTPEYVEIARGRVLGAIGQP